MVLYLVQIDVPPSEAEAFAKYQAGHVAKALAAMGRSAVGSRARAQGDGKTARFFWFFELPTLTALEAYLTSREREDLSGELAAAFPQAKILRSFGELAGNVRRGLRYGEDPGAAFVVDVSIAKDQANGWSSWYDGEHLPQVLGGNGFIRARRFELHDGEELSHHLVIYDAVDLPAVRSFQEDAGQRLASEHERQAPAAKIQRSTWEWIREASAED
jgi:hypothetical protein